MLAILNSCAVFGMNAFLVKVEVDVSSGMPGFDIVGLPDTSVRESKERVRTAIRNSGFEFPLRRIVVNLAPADIKKEGGNFDLAIAAGILIATGQLSFCDKLNNATLVGELSLDGGVKSVNGVLAMAISMGEFAMDSFIVPKVNDEEAALASQATVFGLSSLRQFVEWCLDEVEIVPTEVDVHEMLSRAQSDKYDDMADVKGQEAVKRGMEIAAAGGHNILLIGSPGSGKTMLARRMPSILPDLNLEESLEITRLYSIAGELPAGQGLITSRPFRSPHHSASSASIIGGGRVPQPGEASLAHNGVLFMDEMPEFHRDVLEALRQPMEDKIVTISRVNGRMEFAASFQLVGAMNPCPCGYLGDPHKMCQCTPFQISRYMRKISGPLLDRIDMQIHVQRVPYESIRKNNAGESSKSIKERVMAAREIQRARLKEDKIFCNADMNRSHVQKWCGLTSDAEALLKEAFKKYHLSARSHDRLLKVARTISDLAGSELIGLPQIAEAIQYRGLDNNSELI